MRKLESIEIHIFVRKQQTYSVE